MSNVQSMTQSAHRSTGNLCALPGCFGTTQSADEHWKCVCIAWLLGTCSGSRASCSPDATPEDR